MIKKHTKISLLWLSMVCGSLFGTENEQIERASLSEMFQEHIKNYVFIPHTKREAGFFAAGTVGMGYLWALRSESVPGYVKCILVAPPAVIATHFAVRKLGLFQNRPEGSLENRPEGPLEKTFVPVCSNLTPSMTVASYRERAVNTKVNDTLSTERQVQFEDVKSNQETSSNQSSRRSSTEEKPALELGDDTRINLPKGGISEGLNQVSGQIEGMQEKFDQCADSIKNNCESVAQDVERLRRVVNGSTSNTGAVRRSWWPFGKK